MHGTASEVMSCRGRVAERVECDVRRGRCVAAGKAAAGACFAVVQTRGCVGGARATPAQRGGGGDDDDRHSEMRRRRGVLSLTLARATPEAGPTCQHHTPAPACVPELQEQTARRFSIPLTTPPHRRPDKLCGSVAHYTPCRSLRFHFFLGAASCLRLRLPFSFVRFLFASFHRPPAKSPAFRRRCRRDDIRNCQAGKERTTAVCAGGVLKCCPPAHTAFRYPHQPGMSCTAERTMSQDVALTAPSDSYEPCLSSHPRQFAL